MTSDLRAALSSRVVVADGGMGTMLQGYDLTLDDFQGLEGCNEVLNVTRPDEARPSLPYEDALRNAPQTASGLFVVPKIVE